MAKKLARRVAARDGMTREQLLVLVVDLHRAHASELARKKAAEGILARERAQQCDDCKEKRRAAYQA